MSASNSIISLYPARGNPRFTIGSNRCLRDRIRLLEFLSGLSLSGGFSVCLFMPLSASFSDGRNVHRAGHLAGRTNSGGGVLGNEDAPAAWWGHCTGTRPLNSSVFSPLNAKLAALVPFLGQIGFRTGEYGPSGGMVTHAWGWGRRSCS